MADSEIEKSEKGGAERPKNPRSPHTMSNLNSVGIPKGQIWI